MRQSGKLFFDQMIHNLKVFVINMDTTSFRLKKRGTIDAQFESLRQWWHKSRLQRFKWAVCSPDFSPTENIWSVMKWKVQPELICFMKQKCLHLMFKCWKWAPRGWAATTCDWWKNSVQSTAVYSSWQSGYCSIFYSCEPLRTVNRSMPYNPTKQQLLQYNQKKSLQDKQLWIKWQWHVG